MTRVITVNTLGPFLCSQAVAPRMRERKWGRIVNLTSATIFTGQPRLLHHISSKGAIASLTRSLARELGSDGITVNAIARGLTMTRNMKDNSDYPNEVVQQAIAATDIPTQEQPEHLVGTCLFLVSEGREYDDGSGSCRGWWNGRPLSASDRRGTRGRGRALNYRERLTGGSQVRILSGSPPTGNSAYRRLRP